MDCWFWYICCYQLNFVTNMNAFALFATSTKQQRTFAEHWPQCVAQASCGWQWGCSSGSRLQARSGVGSNPWRFWDSHGTLCLTSGKSPRWIHTHRSWAGCQLGTAWCTGVWNNLTQSNNYMRTRRHTKDALRARANLRNATGRMRLWNIFIFFWNGHH